MSSHTYLIKNAWLINEGAERITDVLIKNGRIEKIDPSQRAPSEQHETINAAGQYLFPGIIDNHVHFREPGLTSKGDLLTESQAALAGGITSTMEMPNTNPPVTDLERLQEKFDLASQKCLTNYSFYLGASNDNLETLKRANDLDICGVKVFMGSSTGNMLVDDKKMLEKILSNVKNLVAVHAEDEQVIKDNLYTIKRIYGEDPPIEAHPKIRDERACYDASNQIINLARKYRSRLHILHVTTQEELGLFDTAPLEEKYITAEACVHHLYFDNRDYEKFGNKIKCFPSIKEPRHKKGLLQGLKEGKLDMIASDHAPHLLNEKDTNYLNAPGGIPMIQHTLPIMLKFYHQGLVSLPFIAAKMAHNPALAYGIKDRGFLREGYYGDCTLVDPASSYAVHKDNIHYKCNWSPFEGSELPAKVTHTFVNGNLVYENNQFGKQSGMQLSFLN